MFIPTSWKYLDPVTNWIWRRSNPNKTILQLDDKIKYVGDNATTVLNEQGKVITTFGQGSKAHRFKK